jgi:sulfoxide reductase heme-binding subunit YedZ
MPPAVVGTMLKPPMPCRPLGERLLLPFLLALPGLWLAWGLAHPSTLGGHVLETLEHVSGRTSLWLLLASLALTPARRWLAVSARLTGARHGKRLSDWNVLVPWRRSLGLAAFAYAVLHLGLYLALDAGFGPDALLEDLTQRRHVVAGALAWLVMLGPAAASLARGAPPPWLRHWPMAAALAALCHVWWTTGPIRSGPWPESLLLGALMLQRLLERVGLLTDWPGSDGDASPVRDAPPSPPRTPKELP